MEDPSYFPSLIGLSFGALTPLHDRNRYHYHHTTPRPAGCGLFPSLLNSITFTFKGSFLEAPFTEQSRSWKIYICFLLLGIHQLAWSPIMGICQSDNGPFTPFPSSFLLSQQRCQLSTDSVVWTEGSPWPLTSLPVRIRNNHSRRIHCVLGWDPGLRSILMADSFMKGEEVHYSYTNGIFYLTSISSA